MDLQTLLTLLRNTDTSDPDAFRRAFVDGMRALGLADEDIVREFGANLTTIARWKSGASVPHHALRGPVISYLIERAEEKS